jgi:hypothetical protein
MEEKKKRIKEKVLHEVNEYLINVVYLSLFFGAFAIARRLTLEQYNIYLDDTFVGLIKALIIAKVIMIGAFMKISRKFENKALLFPIIYKTFLFVLLVVVFDLIEAYIHAWIEYKDMRGALNELIYHHFDKMRLGGLIMIIVSFLPFFALKEISRVLGPQVFKKLFLKKQSEE